jgi:molybdopterin-biosynthesis enzyme MoeA-like protein
MVSSADKLSGVLPSAQEMMEKLALAEAEKAEAAARKQAEFEAEKKLLLDKITKPSGVSDEEAMKRVAVIVNRAVANGLTEVLVYRFPNELCTDHGRAINQQEAGWEKTLTGLPKEMYEFWERRLKPLGYKLKVQIVDWPGGMPGDVGITLKWS